MTVQELHKELTIELELIETVLKELSDLKYQGFFKTSS